MSYCTVEAIGGAATIRHVEDAAQAIEDALGVHTLYSPADTWEVIRGLHGFASDDKWTTELGFQCISVSEIEIYHKNRLEATISSPTVDGRWVTFTSTKGFFMGQLYRLRITGVRGVATLDDLSSGDDVKAGQSVLRGENVVLFLEDGTAEADDKLIVPPALFTSCAISVGRRVMTIENDQLATFEDSTYRRENRFMDGWLVELQKYMRR